MSARTKKRAAEDEVEADFSRLRKPRQSDDQWASEMLILKAQFRKEQEKQAALQTRLAAANAALEKEFGWVNGEPPTPQPQQQNQGEAAQQADQAEDEATAVPSIKTTPARDGQDHVSTS